MASLPWDIKLESAPEPVKKGSIKFHSTLQNHYCNLDLSELPSEEVQTGIMCDIGSKDREVETIQRFIGHGMTVARIVLREMEPDICTQLIHSIRQAVFNYSAELDYVYPLAVLVDIRGPDIVTGHLKTNSTIDILLNSIVKLTTDISWQYGGTSDCLYVGYEHLTALKRGDIVYIDSLSGPKIKLVVFDVSNDALECNVLIGGTIGPKMVVRIAQLPQEVPVQTHIAETNKGDTSSQSPSNDSGEDALEHVAQQVAWAIASDVDGFLISNTESIHDIVDVRESLKEKGKHMLIFACIDTLVGFDHFDEILAEADGIYVDRNVLAISMPVEKVFLATKIMIAKCNYIGKPIIAKAVINESLPALCVTDIANLLIDGVDVLALELHYGAPLHKYAKTAESQRVAEQSVGAVAIICRLTEGCMWRPRIYGNLDLMERSIEDPTRALCISAVELAMRSLAVVIICITNSGRTAKLISHVRPTCPIVAVTRAFHTARQLRFWRGVRAMHYFEVAKATFATEMEARVAAALDYCKIKSVIQAGDPYVVVMGSRRDVGYCDSIRLLYATARKTIAVD